MSISRSYLVSAAGHYQAVDIFCFIGQTRSMKCFSSHSMAWSAPPELDSPGDRLQCAAAPCQGLILSQAQGQSHPVLQEQSFSLVNKGAVCVVPSPLSQNTFYFRCFCSANWRGGGFCSFLDLHTRYVRKHMPPCCTVYITTPGSCLSI